jgi:hypothetical protein
VEDLTARPLDLVIHIQLTRLEVDRLPGEPEDFTPAKAEAEDQDPGGEQRIVAGERVVQETAGLDDGPRLDPTRLPTAAATSSPSACTPTKPTTAPTCADGPDGCPSAYASHAKAPSPANTERP